MSTLNRLIGHILSVSETAPKDEMLGALERYLAGKRLVNVMKMAVSGREQPRPVNGFLPDLEGITLMIGRRVLGVAETCGSFTSEPALARIDALSRDGGTELFVVVPGACYATAKDYIEAKFPRREVTVVPYGKS